MQARVKLPATPLIHYWEFCKIIVDAVCPVDPKLNGVKCVSAIFYSSDLPPDDPKLYEYPILPKGETAFRLITKEDRAVLKKLLPDLPLLRNLMSEKEVAAFMSSYAALPNRPAWTPVLNIETAESYKRRRNDVFDIHLKEIRKDFQEKRCMPVGPDYGPVDAIDRGAHLTREYAISYLRSHGLPYVEDTTMNGLKVSKHTAAERDEAVTKCEKLKATTHNFVALVAKEYCVSEKTINNWVRDKAKRMEASLKAHDPFQKGGR